MDNMTFEKAMERLEEITEKIQSNSCTLDESLSLYEEGIKLSKFCKEKLDGFEKKLNELSETEERSELPF